MDDVEPFLVNCRMKLKTSMMRKDTKKMMSMTVEECISHFENMSVQRRCDKKTLKKIMCGFSLDEHNEHLKKSAKKNRRI